MRGGVGLGGKLAYTVGVKARITCQAPQHPTEEKLVLVRCGWETGWGGSSVRGRER